MSKPLSARPLHHKCQFMVDIKKTFLSKKIFSPNSEFITFSNLTRQFITTHAHIHIHTHNTQTQYMFTHKPTQICLSPDIYIYIIKRISLQVNNSLADLFI